MLAVLSNNRSLGCARRSASDERAVSDGEKRCNSSPGRRRDAWGGALVPLDVYLLDGCHFFPDGYSYRKKFGLDFIRGLKSPPLDTPLVTHKTFSFLLDMRQLLGNARGPARLDFTRITPTRSVTSKGHVTKQSAETRRNRSFHGISLVSRTACG